MMGQQRSLGVLWVLVLTWLGQVAQTEGQLESISVGPAGVWGVTPDEEVVYRVGTYGDPDAVGTDWNTSDGNMVQVDVGTDIVWGVNFNGKIYYRKNITRANNIGDTWELVHGSLKHVTVSPRGSVWGVNSYDNIFFRQGASTQNPGGDSWVQVTGKLKQISAGGAGVWGVAPDNLVFYRQGTYNDTEGTGSGWTQVGDTKMTYVSSGEKRVFCLTTTGKLGYRKGVSSSNPTGTGWSYFEDEGRMVVDSYKKAIWSVDGSTNVFVDFLTSSR